MISAVTARLVALPVAALLVLGCVDERSDEGIMAVQWRAVSVNGIQIPGDAD